ncbi:hypothetical protein Q1695_011136 [Nippostrongylus brasiliensis]|nr:hypothetical protein Q1695_011136 [Nippostrongylus brasiliensis]
MPILVAGSGDIFKPKRRFRIMPSGDSESYEVDIQLPSDFHYVQLPQRVIKALTRSRRVVVQSDGRIRPLPYELDENLEPHGCQENVIDPTQRRILHALEMERARIVAQESSKGQSVLEDNKENEIFVRTDETEQSSAEGIGSEDISMEESEEGPDEEADDTNMELYSALGFSPAQIDRLINAPLWPAVPKVVEEMQTSLIMEEEEDDDDDKEAQAPSERSWEVAVILCPHLVKNENGTKDKEYKVIWKDWPWNDCWSLSPSCFDSGEKRLAAADTRERLISQMATYMQNKDKKAFDEQFPQFHKRHDYSSWHRVQLRLVEQSINDELEALDIAPIYFENWTGDERATIDVKYLTRCAMSISNYREAKAVGVALRMQYPEDGAGCDCKDGQCTPFCPCVKIMGRDQIRMRSTGKVDVDKLAEAITVECGTTCSCGPDCPSKYAERGRKIPLVVMFTTTKGWSVYAPQIIPAGTYLGSYIGEIIPLCTAIAQGVSTSYQFTNIHQIPGTKQYVVDASRMGNETRYFNHACGDAANLKAVSLLSRGNLLTNNMLFFTKRTISKGEELTFSYRGKDAEGPKNGIRCLCTPGCQSRL